MSEATARQENGQAKLPVDDVLKLLVDADCYMADQQNTKVQVNDIWSRYIDPAEAQGRKGDPEDPDFARERRLTERLKERIKNLQPTDALTAGELYTLLEMPIEDLSQDPSTAKPSPGGPDEPDDRPEPSAGDAEPAPADARDQGRAREAGERRPRGGEEPSRQASPAAGVTHVYGMGGLLFTAGTALNKSMRAVSNLLTPNGPEDLVKDYSKPEAYARFAERINEQMTRTDHSLSALETGFDRDGNPLDAKARRQLMVDASNSIGVFPRDLESLQKWAGENPEITEGAEHRPGDLAERASSLLERGQKHAEEAEKHPETEKAAKQLKESIEAAWQCLVRIMEMLFGRSAKNENATPGPAPG